MVAEIRYAFAISEARYRAVAEQVEDGIFIADREGRKVWISKTKGAI